MKTAWLKGLNDAQEKDDIKASFKASRVLRARLMQMLDDKSNSCERASMDAEGYECANWAYKMADAQGYKRALSEIISLISDNSLTKR